MYPNTHITALPDAKEPIFTFVSFTYLQLSQFSEQLPNTSSWTTVILHYFLQWHLMFFFVLRSDKTKSKQKTSGQSNLTKGCIAVAHGWFNRIRQVAPTYSTI